MKKASAILGAALLIGASGCGAATDAGAGAPPAKPPTQYIVGIDISGSRTPSQLREEQQVVDGLIDRMTWGDRLVLIETYRAGIDSAGQWHDSIPAQRVAGRTSSRDRQNLEQFQVVARQINGTFFDPEKSKKIMSTDLFHTLSRAADYAKAANGRKTTVVLLSDMLHSTNDVNMERAGGVPGPSWTDERKAAGRLPDLSNVCVFVVGADPTTKRGAEVRGFWRHYFEATGATFRPGNYRNMVADPAEIRCD